MPAKHQPDHAFLRHVPLRRIHLFTLVQILCLAVLWILKSTVAAIIFPVMVSEVGLASPPAGGPLSLSPPWWLDSGQPGTEQDWSCKSRPGAAGQVERRAAKVVCAVVRPCSDNSHSHLHSTQLAKLSESAKATNRPALGQDGEAEQL